MKKFVVFWGFLLFLQMLFAQQTVYFSSYFNNEIAYNPAIVGSKPYNPLNITTREQWLGFSESPLTTGLSYHGAVNNRSGLGGTVLYDKTGPSSCSSLEMDYAYRIALDNNDLNMAFGVGAKCFYYTLNLDEETLPPGNDPAFDAKVYDQFVADANFGLYLYGSNFYAGCSALNLIQSKFNKEEGDGYSTNRLQRNYLGILGYRYAFNRDMLIEPSVLLRTTDQHDVFYQVNTRVFFQNVLWLGAGVKSDESVSAMLGFKAGKHLQISYAYDYYFTTINAYQFGTHEIGIQFSIPSLLYQRHTNFWQY